MILKTPWRLSAPTVLAKDFKLGHLKFMYIMNYDRAPCFKQLNSLMRNYKMLLYSVSFDESFNEITQESEMSVMVQYWDEEKIKFIGP